MNIRHYRLALIIMISAVVSTGGQSVRDKGADKSIGGAEHESAVYGVRIGMDVESALRAVFINAERVAGQEKPDVLRREGESKKDIRVLYKSLPKGELQIVFHDGSRVSQIILSYKQEPIIDDLRLPYSGTIGSTTSTIHNTSAAQSGTDSPVLNDGSKSIEEFASVNAGKLDRYNARKVGNVDRSQGDLLDGTRYDDRYSVGYVDSLRLQKIWWRDEKTDDGFSIRVAFVGKKQTSAGGKFVPSVVQKIISINPGDQEKFDKSRP